MEKLKQEARNGQEEKALAPEQKRCEIENNPSNQRVQAKRIEVLPEAMRNVAVPQEMKSISIGGPQLDGGLSSVHAVIALTLTMQSIDCSLCVVN